MPDLIAPFVTAPNTAWRFQWLSFAKHVLGAMAIGIATAWIAGGGWREWIAAGFTAGAAAAKSFVVQPKQ